MASLFVGMARFRVSASRASGASGASGTSVVEQLAVAVSLGLVSQRSMPPARGGRPRALQSLRVTYISHVAITNVISLKEDAKVTNIEWIRGFDGSAACVGIACRFTLLEGGEGISPKFVLVSVVLHTMAHHRHIPCLDHALDICVGEVAAVASRVHVALLGLSVVPR
mmetsp:Transcript_159863/g.298106  ORF Transcript_159863/g.298106 Transcript_159863/m.298106 type:complete len:168 (+) Transcript_159863:288-791(+)